MLGSYRLALFKKSLSKEPFKIRQICIICENPRGAADPPKYDVPSDGNPANLKIL